MSAKTAVENRLERLVGQRLTRFIEFCGVGATGMVVDLAVTTTLLGSTHYLLANAAGFLLAVSWNFGGNWLVTFDQPEGSVPRQYVSYVGLHATTFVVRAVVLTALVELAGVPALVATLVGIAAAAIANYLGTERILDSGLEWFDAVAALNSVAHVIYGSRVRHVLRATGLYALLYRTYARALELVYRGDTVTIDAAGAQATLHASDPAELVSVLHTYEKEQPILAAFVGAIDEGAVVWDVGANLGVFAALAADAGADVVAVEPVPDTADRLTENLRLGDARAHVVGAALSDTSGTATLKQERDDLGTQTPTLAEGVIDSRGTRTVETVTGDDLVAAGAPTPDVLKIDVEGAEAAVLDGLVETLPHVERVFVEVHGTAVGVRGRLEAAGFDVDVLDHAESGQAYLAGRRP